MRTGDTTAITSTVMRPTALLLQITDRRTPKLHEPSIPVSPSSLCRRMLHAVHTTESIFECRKGE